jgi:hypothetical protein
MRLSIALRAVSASAALAVLVMPALAGGRTHQQNTSDPFSRPVDKKKVPVPVPKETIVEPPSLDARETGCKTSTKAGESVETSPCMYLVREVELTGVSRSENGVEAFLYAAPTKQTILVHVGDHLYDGRVLAIDEATDSGGARVTLEKTTQKQIGKKMTTLTSQVTLGLASSTLDR